MSTTKVRHRRFMDKPTSARTNPRADLTLGGLADALNRTAREEGHPAPLKVGPRPAKLHDGDVVILFAQGDEMVAIPFAHPSPKRAVPLTEAEAAVLSEGGFSPKDVTGKDTVEASAQAYANLLAQSLSVAQAAELLGINASRIRQRLGGPRRSLYGIKIREEWVLPSFQFAGKGTVPGIEEVIAELDPELHPVAVLRWFSTPNPDLEIDGEGKTVSPLDWLRTGHPSATVAELARGL